MKLFQRLLVAPAALGLLAPMTASANEVNLNEISNYSDVESIEFANFNNEISTNSTLLAGGEGLTDDHDHGSDDSFSSTTSASFSVDMAIGAVDGNTTSEAVQTAYGYQMDLSTSFTGEDSLNVAIKSGDGGSGLAELDLNDFSDKLTVDGITYTFPLGEKLTVLVGDSTDGSSLYSTACVYGGFTNTLDDCGNANSAFTSPSDSVALSASYDIGNGFTGAFGYAGQGSSSSGLMTKGGTDYYGAQVSYAADNYGASVTYANIESLDDTTFWGLNAYYVPDSSLPSISAGYEMGDPTTAKDSTQWFVGLQWDEVGPGTLGVAAGSKGAITDGADELLAYEAFYSYPVNDGMTITPAVFIMENATGSEDETGVVVKTSFSF